VAEPPLFAGSILGLRSWDVRVAQNGDLRLCAAFGDSIWEPEGRWTQAHCLTDGYGGRHSVPDPDCSCGLYAHHPHLEQARAHEAGYWSEADRLNPGDGSFAELGEVSGLVEACGRIEVHESGFRAERARPVVLLVGRNWSASRRRGVERVARLHRAEVLEVGRAEELVAYCERRGGALDPDSVAELLEAARPAPAEQSALTAPARSHPAPIAAGRGRRLLGTIGRAAEIGLIGLVAVLWYGFWAALAIGVAGAILFGWGEERPWKAPARVERVTAERAQCRVDAVVKARLPIKRLRLGIVAVRPSGERFARAVRAVGPVPKGTSTVRVAEMGRRLCRSPSPFTVRVRALYGANGAGHVAQALSRPTGAVRRMAPPPTHSRR
jgi:hypothetical protein